jgi:protocatechuate 3,4-dioxygenase beta subunit
MRTMIPEKYSSREQRSDPHHIHSTIEQPQLMTNLIKKEEKKE